MIDVTGVGVNSIDRVLRIPTDTLSLVASGKVRISSDRWLCGGQTATAMSACAALGLTVRYIGAFGSDEHGARIRTELVGRGVDVRHAVQRSAVNAGAVILVDTAGRRTVLWTRDESLSLEPAEVPPGSLQDSRLIHVDDVDRRAALHACGIARAAGIPVTSDIEQVIDGADELVRAVTHPIFDHNAPAAFTGESDPERALRKLRRLNPGLLCMTLGREGAAALDGDVFHLAPGHPVTAIDTTGAGDVFRGAFIYGLLHGWRVPEILRFANAAAALSCTRPGAIDSVPTLIEVTRVGTGGSVGALER